MKTNRSLSLRILSVLLCLCMMLGMLPAIAMAEGELSPSIVKSVTAGVYPMPMFGIATDHCLAIGPALP